MSESGIPDHTVDVMVSMRHSFLKRLDNHLEKLGEGNRSAYIRRATLNQIRRDRGDLTTDEEAED